MKQKETILSLFNPAKLKSVLSFGFKGYLEEIGWFQSFRTQTPVDKNGNPIPWVTYSFIDFIKERITSTMHIFEYGSGNSTAYYAALAKQVTAVEHDESWYKKVVKNKPVNAEIIYKTLTKDGDYARAAVQSGQKYEIIIVDGRDRVNCCRHAVDALSNGGVIVLDDSERAKYLPAIEYLTDSGFKHLSFSGISPGLFYNKATSVFYRDGNCLNI